MSTQTEPQTTSRRVDAEPMVHTYCCDEDTALCGEDLSGGTETDEARECVVCEDLVEQGAPCSRRCRVRSWLRWNLKDRWQQ